MVVACVILLRENIQFLEIFEVVRHKCLPHIKKPGRYNAIIDIVVCRPSFFVAGPWNSMLCVTGCYASYFPLDVNAPLFLAMLRTRCMERMC